MEVLTVSPEQAGLVEYVVENAEDWAVNGKEVADVMKRNLFRLLDSTGKVDDLTVLLAACRFRTADARKEAAFTALEAVRATRTAIATQDWRGILLRSSDIALAGAEFIRLDKELAKDTGRTPEEIANS